MWEFNSFLTFLSPTVYVNERQQLPTSSNQQNAPIENYPSRTLSNKTQNSYEGVLE